MAISTEDFVKQIETMSVLDLNHLVKALEERFGVSAAAASVSAARTFSSSTSRAIPNTSPRSLPSASCSS